MELKTRASGLLNAREFPSLASGGSAPSHVGGSAVAPSRQARTTHRDWADDERSMPMLQGGSGGGGGGGGAATTTTTATATTTYHNRGDRLGDRASDFDFPPPPPPPPRGNSRVGAPLSGGAGDPRWSAAGAAGAAGGVGGDPRWKGAGNRDVASLDKQGRGGVSWGRSENRSTNNGAGDRGPPSRDVGREAYEAEVAHVKAQMEEERMKRTGGWFPPNGNGAVASSAANASTTSAAAAAAAAAAATVHQKGAETTAVPVKNAWPNAAGVRHEPVRQQPQQNHPPPPQQQQHPPQQVDATSSQLAADELAGLQKPTEERGRIRERMEAEEKARIERAAAKLRELEERMKVKSDTPALPLHAQMGVSNAATPATTSTAVPPLPGSTQQLTSVPPPPAHETHAAAAAAAAAAHHEPIPAPLQHVYLQHPPHHPTQPQLPVQQPQLIVHPQLHQHEQPQSQALEAMLQYEQQQQHQRALYQQAYFNAYTSPEEAAMAAHWGMGVSPTPPASVEVPITAWSAPPPPLPPQVPPATDAMVSSAADTSPAGTERRKRGGRRVREAEARREQRQRAAAAAASAAAATVAAAAAAAAAAPGKDAPPDGTSASADEPVTAQPFDAWGGFWSLAGVSSAGALETNVWNQPGSDADALWRLWKDGPQQGSS